MSILHQHIKVTRGSAQAVFVATSSGASEIQLFQGIQSDLDLLQQKPTLKKPSSLTLLKEKPPISQMMIITMLGHHETSPISGNPRYSPGYKIREGLENLQTLIDWCSFK